MKKIITYILSLCLIANTAAFAKPNMAVTVERAKEKCSLKISSADSYVLSENTSSSLLTGEIISQGEFHNNISNAWNDGVTDVHFFMIYDKTDDVYVGYKLDKPTVITSAVLYADRRKGNSSAFDRINGTTVEGSNDGITWTVLATISDEHKSDILNTADSKVDLTINSTVPYTYIRYCAKAGAIANASGYICFAEVLFYGHEYVKQTEKLNFGAKIESQRNTSYASDWSDGSYSNNSSTDRVFFYNKIGGYTGTPTDAYAGFDYGTHFVTPTKMVIVPHKSSDSYNRLNNSVIQGRTEDGVWETIMQPDFSPYTNVIEKEDLVIEFDIDTTKEYSALRLFRGKENALSEYLGFCDLAFYGTFTFNTNSKIEGSMISSHKDDLIHYIGKPSYVLDGNVSTIFMANSQGTDGNAIWVGYDFGENRVKVSSMRYYGRHDANTPARIKGQQVQGSNDGQTWELIHTIQNGTQGVYTTEYFLTSKPYRYIRLNDADGTTSSFFCHAEIEFYGVYAEEYTLSFNAGEVEASVPESITDFEGTTIDLSKYTPENISDYVFTGWVNEQGNITEGTIELNRDLILTAVWKYAGIAPLTYEKNSIRVSEPSGIRFISSIRNEVKADEMTTEYGYIVTRSSLLGGKDPSYLTLDQTDIKYVTGVSYGYDKNLQKNVDRIYSIENDYTFFTAVVYGVQNTKEAYSENIIARPYIKYNGEVIYGKPMSRSVLDTAKSLRDSGYKDLDEYAISYINNILTICEENV